MAILLVTWVLVPVAALLPWIGVVIARRGHDVEDHSAEPHADSAAVGQVWRSPLAWGMAGMFGMTSLVTYSMFTWIPAILASAGGSAKLGGVMVALFSAVGFIGTLAIPPLAARMRNPSHWWRPAWCASSSVLPDCCGCRCTGPPCGWSRSDSGRLPSRWDSHW